MPDFYPGIQWVVQRNLTSITDLESLQRSCETVGVSFQAIDIIPFSDALPAFPHHRRSIFYGSTTLCSLVAADVQWRPGLFFDETLFSILSPDTPIVVSAPYNIQYEWRLWIVNGKVITASKYRTYFKLTKEAGCPDDVITFAESRCREYTPHAVFVMDVCLCGDEFYIVECGCMNAAGFYKADVTAIVAAVSAYFANISQ